MDAQPIFIVGPPRSGTTLTARILDNHSRLFMPGETHFFEDILAAREQLGDPKTAVARERILQRLLTLYRRYDELADQARIDRIVLGKPSAFSASACGWRDYKDVLSSFMSVQMRSEGKCRWGNNVPRDLFHMDEILSFYPDAKIILCIRDSRDFLLSYRNRWRTASNGHRERIRRLYHPIMTALLWRANARCGLALHRKVAPANLFVLRYEALVNAPEDSVRGICQFIGEEFEPGMLHVRFNNSSVPGRSQGIYNSSVGHWKGGLSQEEVAIIQLIAGREMREFGYGPAAVSPRWRTVAAQFATLPYAGVRALRANYATRGGTLFPYLGRRLAAMFGRVD